MTAALQDYICELLSGDDERAEGAIAGIAALAQTGSQDVLPVIKELLTEPDDDARWWGVRALAALDDPAVPILLMDSFTDEKIAVRQCAALGLRLHPDPRAVLLLLNALGENNRLLAQLAADALIEIGEPAVPALIEVMDGGSRLSRMEAVRALATIADTRAIPALFEALDEDSAYIEHWAALGLERMGVGMVFFDVG